MNNYKLLYDLLLEKNCFLYYFISVYLSLCEMFSGKIWSQVGKVEQV